MIVPWRRLAAALSIAALVFSEMADARVFNFQKQTVSTYLRGSYGLVGMDKTAFEPGFPTTVSFAGQPGVTQAYSGEFGFAFSSKYVSWRAGVELLNPAQAKDINGSSSGGTRWLSVSSEVYSVIPQLNLEFMVRQGPSWRWYVGGGVGYALTTFKNTVTMTSAGSTALSVGDYIEEGSASGLMSQGMTGLEFAFFDNVGFSIDLGYRYLVATDFKSNRETITPCRHFYTGNTITNCDGTNRSANLGGLFSAAAFRIYFQ